MKIDKKIAVSLYRHMLRVRMVEETIAKLYAEQEMRCPVHLCIGQEAIAVGVCACLSKEDYMVSNHRSHGHYLAKGGDLKAMFAEIYGKATGCSRGKGGSMHLVDLSCNIVGTTPIVGGIIPIAVGLAFGITMKQEKSLSAVFFGDAATEEGVFFESLNFASLKKLPVLFICENNFFSVYSPLSVRQPKERSNVSIVRSLGIRTGAAHGNDVAAVYESAKEAVMSIRAGKGPYYLEFDTYRWREHCGPNYDNDLGYRPESEFLEWRKRCPVDTCEKGLMKKGDIAGKQIEEFRQKIQNEIDEAISFAKSSPFPKTETIFTDIYAE